MGNSLTALKAGRRWARYDLVRIVLALFLLFGASLKAYQLSTGPIVSSSLLDSRGTLIGIVEFEFALGLWLLFGLQARWTWRVALSCFTIFAGVSFFKALAGESSCGCFGQLQVSPWLTMTLDLSAVAALLRWQPTSNLSDSPSRAPMLRIVTVSAVLLLVGVPTTLTMANYQPTTLAGDGIIVGSGNMVVLEPEKWVGQPFPLLRYIDIGPLFEQGRWQVVFYRHDCQRCQEKVPYYRQLGQSLQAAQRDTKLVILELPSYGSKLDLSDTPHAWAQLSEEKKWLVSTPLLLVLADGIVESTQTLQ